MFRGWRDTMSAPHRMKASRLPTRDRAASAWTGSRPAACGAYETTRRPTRRRRRRRSPTPGGRPAGDGRAADARHPAPPRSHRPAAAGLTAPSIVPREVHRHGVDLHHVPQPLGERGRRALGIEPRPVEPPVDEALDAPAQRLEQRRTRRASSRDRDRRGLGERREERLQPDDRDDERRARIAGHDGPRDRAADHPVDLVQVVAQDRDADRDREHDQREEPDVEQHVGDERGRQQDRHREGAAADRRDAISHLSCCRPTLPARGTGRRRCDGATGAEDGPATMSGTPTGREQRAQVGSARDRVGDVGSAEGVRPDEEPDEHDDITARNSDRPCPIARRATAARREDEREVQREPPGRDRRTRPPREGRGPGPRRRRRATSRTRRPPGSTAHSQRRSRVMSRRRCCPARGSQQRAHDAQRSRTRRTRPGPDSARTCYPRRGRIHRARPRGQRGRASTAAAHPVRRPPG